MINLIYLYTFLANEQNQAQGHIQQRVQQEQENQEPDQQQTELELTDWEVTLSEGLYFFVIFSIKLYFIKYVFTFIKSSLDDFVTSAANDRVDQFNELVSFLETFQLPERLLRRRTQREMHKIRNFMRRLVQDYNIEEESPIVFRMLNSRFENFAEFDASTFTSRCRENNIFFEQNGSNVIMVHVDDEDTESRGKL